MNYTITITLEIPVKSVSETPTELELETWANMALDMAIKTKTYHVQTELRAQSGEVIQDL